MRRSLLLLTTLSLVWLGCSSSSNSSGGSKDAGGNGDGGGGSDAPAIVAQAEVATTLNPSGNPMYSGACPVGSPTDVLTIGNDPGSGTPMTVGDGMGAMISCTVHPDGSGFDVSLKATVPGGSGGTLTITSASGQPVTTMGGMGLSATMDASAENYGVYSGMSCTLDYNNARSNPPIAAGRIWGHVNCQVAMDTSSHTCAIDAQFVFENCGM